MNRTLDTRTTAAGHHVERVAPETLTLNDIIWSKTGRPFAVTGVRRAAQPTGGRAVEVTMRQVGGALAAELGDEVVQLYTPSQTVEVSAPCQRWSHSGGALGVCPQTKPYRYTCMDCGTVTCDNSHYVGEHQCVDCYRADEYAVGLG